jgi:putative PIN family toxin of toxin-antitoxin system
VIVRVVIDTNVLISAIFWTGKPKQLLNKVRHREITFITSKILLDELKEVLVRKDKPFRLSEEESDRIVSAVRDIAEIIQPSSQVDICEHQNDNRVLECAMDGGAEFIVTGDSDLLELKFFRTVKIITVREFLIPPLTNA